jgi:hypothetical protein
MTKKSTDYAPVSSFSQSRSKETQASIADKLCSFLSSLGPEGICLHINDINTISGILIRAYERQYLR